MELFKELFLFLKERKKIWLWILFSILFLLASLIALTQGSAIAPFIYSLF